MIGFGFTISLNDAFSNVAGKVQNSFAGLQGMSDKARASVNKSAVQMETGFKMMAAGAAILAPVGIAVGKAMDFEAQLSSIKAVTGSSAEVMKQYQAEALKAGADTKYSALEAAQGIEELAKAGVESSQILGGGLTAALNLATAGEVSVADAAEIASTALNAFKADAMSIEDAGNILAGAANASATSVGELKFGLSAVSAVASGAGVSFKDTNTALAVLAQNGLKGSDAGTSLKTMLMNLSPATKEGAEQMRKLGLIAADGSNAFFDAQGRVKSLADVSGVLKNSLSNLNPKEQGEALRKMFGSDAIRAGNIFLKEGAEGFNKMADAMGKVSMAQVAEERLNNLKGSIEQFSGSFETVMINVGMALTPILKKIVDFGTGVVNAFNSFAQSKIGGVVVQITAAIGGALLVGGALIVTVASLKIAFITAIPVIKSVGVAISSAIGAPLLPVIAGIGVLVGSVVFLKKSWENFSGVMNGGEVASGGFMRVMQQVGGVMQGISSLFNTASASGFAFSEEMDSAFDKLGIKDLMLTLGTYASRIAAFFDGFKTGYSTSIAPAFSKISEAFSKVFNAFTPIIALGERIYNVFVPSLDRAQSSTLSWADAGNSLASAIGTAFSFIGGVIGGIGEVIGFVANQLSMIGNLFIDTFQNISGLWQNYQEGWLSFGELFTGIGTAIVDALWNGITSSWDNFKNMLIGLVGELPFGDKILAFAGVSGGAKKGEVGSDAATVEKIAQVGNPMSGKLNNIKENAVAQNAAKVRVGQNAAAGNNAITVQPTPVNLYLDGEKIATNVNEINQRESNRK